MQTREAVKFDGNREDREEARRNTRRDSSKPFRKNSADAGAHPGGIQESAPRACRRCDVKALRLCRLRQVPITIWMFNPMHGMEDPMRGISNPVLRIENPMRQMRHPLRGLDIRC